MVETVLPLLLAALPFIAQYIPEIVSGAEWVGSQIGSLIGGAANTVEDDASSWEDW